MRFNIRQGKARDATDTFIGYKQITLFWVFIALIVLMQDYLYSVVNHSSFYWSESLIFKIFWLGMTGFTIITLTLNNRINEYFKKGYLTIVSHSIGFIVLSLGYLLLVSFLIGIIAQKTLHVPFRSLDILKHFVTDQYYVLILIYIFTSFLYHITIQRSKSAKAKGVIPEPPKLSFNIEVKQKGKVLVINIREIDYIKAETPYGAIFCKGKKFLSARNLTQLEKELVGHPFQRVHRTSLVNLHQIQELKSRGNGDYDIKLKDGTIIRMSRRYSQRVKRLVTGLSPL